MTVDDLVPLEARLGSLTRAALTALLERRPDVLIAVAPRSIHQLAARLWNRQELTLALREVALPHLQLLEAALALGSGVTIDELTALLDGGRRVVVEHFVDFLDERAVLMRDGETLILPSALYRIFPDPLGFGTPLMLLLTDRSVDSLRQVQAALGLRRTGKRADTVAALVEWFRNADAVRGLIAQAPADVREYLAHLVDPRDEPAHDSARYRRRFDAERWASGHGLVVPSYYHYGMAMPAEVTRALRGPAYRAPFTPQPPVVAAHAADADRLARDSAAAAGQFVAQLLTVLDAVAQAPLAALKSGGVGARELARLVRTTGAEAAQVRLILELARELDLLDTSIAGTSTAGTICAGARYAAWRAGEPVDQFVDAVLAWWRVDATLTETRTDDGKPIAPLAVPRGCGGCRAARQALAETLDLLAVAVPDEPQPDADAVAAPRADVARLALWRRPLVHIVAGDAADPLATPWREAEMLSVIADDALTPLGRALVHGADVAAVTAIAASLLPAATDQATFGADLTVYVLGTPSARVSALLDSCADREGRGTATTWRLHPASVRRALDAGTQAPVLLDELAAITTGELPQPLRYLISDVARRHGHLRVGTATCVIIGDDPALLAQVAADRRLRKLAARMLAPTVLACEVALPVAMAALRDAGYFPLAADAADAVQTGDGAPDSAAPAPVPAPSRRRSPRTRQPADRIALEPAAVAAALTGAAARIATDPGATARDLLASGAVLSDAEVRLLAAAVDRPERVGIDYVSAAGVRSRHIVDGPLLDGPLLIGWCELRDEEWTFTVSRITGIFAV